MCLLRAQGFYLHNSHSHATHHFWVRGRKLFLECLRQVPRDLASLGVIRHSLRLVIFQQSVEVAKGRPRSRDKRLPGLLAAWRALEILVESSAHVVFDIQTADSPEWLFHQSAVRLSECLWVGWVALFG